MLVGDDRFVSQADGALHPGCDFGRGSQECVPAPINVRIQDYPRLAIDARGQVLAAVWQDYRNGGCRSSAADALAACRASGAGSNENYEIVEAVSRDGGATWTSRVIDDSSRSAQFEPAVAINQQTGAVAISFYDHGYEADAANGWYDYSVSIAPSADGELRKQRVCIHRTAPARIYKERPRLHARQEIPIHELLSLRSEWKQVHDHIRLRQHVC